MNNTENTVTKYIATILIGDEYHKEGEEHEFYSGLLDSVKKNGLRLEAWQNNWDESYHYYPVSIRKETYKLELIDVSSVEGGGREEEIKWGQKIGYDRVEREKHDWRDHWC